MLIAPLPPNESARLALLRGLQLLDSEPEEIFDRVTRLLARVLDVPIALVSLVDSERQWFKSRVGLDACETSRDLAFCAHAILDTKPLVVPDAREDLRFFDNPLVADGPLIRFYAGVPLYSADGLGLGTLCAIDTKPRQLSPADLQALIDCADIVRRELLQREVLLATRQETDISQRALAASQTHLHAVFEQAAVGMARVGLDGSFLQVNRKLCEIIGYNETELMALNFQQITHADDLDSDLDLLQQTLAGQRNQYMLEKRYIRKSGELMWINLTVSLARDSAGNPDYFISVIENIDARKEAETALQTWRLNLEHEVDERTRQLRAVLVNSPDAYLSIDENGNIIDWNPQAENTFGWSADEALGQRMSELLVSPKARPAHQRGREFLSTLKQQPTLSQRSEFIAIGRDGNEFPVEMSLCVLPSESGIRFSAFLRDIRERKQAETALRRSREQIRAIADNVPAMIAYINKDLTYGFVSAGYRTLAQVEPGTMIGKTHLEVFGEEEMALVEAYYRRALAGEQVEFEVHDPRFEKFWQTRLQPDIKDGQVLGFFSIASEVTGIKHAEMAYRREAHLDLLTGLPNRRALTEHLRESLIRCDRSARALGVLFLDLNRFKRINDDYGHEVGDDLLRQFAERLGRVVRRSDMVARLSGDEFVIVIESLAGGCADAQMLAQKIKDNLAEPFLLAGQQEQIGASIGVVLHNPGDDNTVESLLAAADKSMYENKRAPSHLAV